jgi:hypothetical protein
VHKFAIFLTGAGLIAAAAGCSGEQPVSRVTIPSADNPDTPRLTYERPKPMPEQSRPLDREVPEQSPPPADRNP